MLPIIEYLQKQLNREPTDWEITMEFSRQISCLPHYKISSKGIEIDDGQGEYDEDWKKQKEDALKKK